MANRYSVLLKFLENSNSHLIFEFEGKKKFRSYLVFMKNKGNDAAMLLRFIGSTPFGRKPFDRSTSDQKTSVTNVIKLFTAVRFDFS
jgi:hypothetical protein